MSVSQDLDSVMDALDAFKVTRDGSHVQRYCTTRLMLGSGSFGKVLVGYRALCGGCWVRIAVKEIRLLDATGAAEMVRRVEAVGREGALCYNARSQRVVSVYQPWFDADRGVLCIPQELCDESLDRFRRRHGGGPDIPLPMLLSVFFQCLEALDDLARAQIVHCDVKPDNVMLAWPHSPDTGLPEVRLADFGLSAPAAEIAALTRPAPVGTPYYMAPESYTLDGAAAPQARDTWSMGCLFLELLTGHRPFAATSLPELRRRTGAVDLVAFPGLAALDPARAFLHRLAISALMVDPQRRPTAAALRVALARGVSPPPLSGLRPVVPRTYRRMAVCRAQAQVPLFSAPGEGPPTAVLTPFHESIFVAIEPTANGGGGGGSRRGPKSHQAGDLPPPLPLQMWPTDGEEDCRSPKSAVLPAARAGAEAPPQWLRVVYPLRGYCRVVAGGHPTLHDYEDPRRAACGTPPPAAAAPPIDGVALRALTRARQPAAATATTDAAAMGYCAAPSEAAGPPPSAGPQAPYKMKLRTRPH